MSTRIKLLAAALFVMPLAPIGAAAQTADAAAAVERMCDYCEDYTDAATSGGAVQSAYQPVVGYAAAAYGQAAATIEPRQDGHRILMFRVEKK